MTNTTSILTPVRLVERNVDGCETDVDLIIDVEGPEVTKTIIDQVQAAVAAHKKDSDGEWYSDDCFDAAIECLQKNGYIVVCRSVPSIEIEI